MKKYITNEEEYSTEVSRILVDNNLICADDYNLYKGYLLGVV